MIYLTGMSAFRDNTIRIYLASSVNEEGSATMLLEMTHQRSMERIPEEVISCQVV
jgi:hypothetical protein